MSGLASTIRDAARSIRTTPVLSGTIVVLLALGIGATTAVFSLLDRLLFETLPVEAQDKVVQLTSTALPPFGGSMGQGLELPYPAFEALSDAGSEVSISGAAQVPVHVGVGGAAERVNAELVSGDYFSVLLVRVAFGRAITSDDERPGAPPVVVLTDSYWRRRLNGDSSRIGSILLINGNPVTIVGVMQEGFQGFDLDEPAQVFLPLRMRPSAIPATVDPDSRLFRWVRVYARIPGSSTVATARAQLEPAFHSFMVELAGTPPLSSAEPAIRNQFLKSRLEIVSGARPLSAVGIGHRQSLWALWGVTITVLLILSLNVASLLAVKASARRQEIAVRIALGARWAHIGRQLLLEAACLAVCGGAIGVVMSGPMARTLTRLLRSDTGFDFTTLPTPRVLGFGLLLTAMTCVIVALWPYIEARRSELADTLRGRLDLAGRGTSSRAHRAIIVAQVALAIVVFAGGAAFVQSLDNLLRVDLGVAADRLLMFRLDTNLNRYTPARAMQLSERISSQLAQAPGVRAVAYSDIPLLDGSGWFSPMRAERGAALSGSETTARLNVVSPGYFAAIGLPQIAGRDFNSDDADPGGASFFRAAIVNERFVKMVLPSGTPPIGQRIAFAVPGAPRWIPIVGVVGDAKYASVREEPLPQVFVPVTGGVSGFTFYVRTEGAPSDLFATVRRTVANVDPTLPASQLRSLEDQRRRSLGIERLMASLGELSAAVAAILMAIGIHGVIAFVVAKRTREIGIRLALGGTAWTVVRQLFGESAPLVGGGLAIGTAVTLTLARIADARLYGVTLGGAKTLVACALATTVISVIALARPAWKAASISPLVAMRAE